MAKIGIRKLRQHLGTLSVEELQEEVVTLFNKFSDVKEYYQIQLSEEDEEQILAKYKKIVQNELFPTRGFGKLRLSVARKAVTDYKKISTSPEKQADLMMFYVEMCAKVTDAYGDIHEAFYDSMIGMCQNALELLAKHSLQEQLRIRLLAVMRMTGGIGWGVNEALEEIYDLYF